MKEIKKVSPLISSQLPEFVREDHPFFVQFMEAYYEWMEQNGNAVQASQNLTNIRDIDYTVDDFVEHFKNTYLNTLPNDVLADKKKLLKHIRQFYRAKGTEKSFRLLFNILYQSPVDFYYPHTNILRPSNGKWQQDRILRVSSISGDMFNFVASTIIGKNTNSSAFVDEVKSITVGPFLVFELYLNRSSILGSFEPGEIIRSQDGVEARISPLFGGIDFSISAGGNPGFGYALEDKIIITGGSGQGATAKVSSIGLSGEILKAEITNYGFNYDILPDALDITINSVGGIGAIGIPSQTAIADMKGYWINDDGKLNSADRIQDGVFYQQYSYVIYVNQSLERYRQLVKDLVHPAGLIFFGGYRVESFVDASAFIPNGHGNIKLIFPRVPAIVDENSNPVILDEYNTLPETYHYKSFLSPLGADIYLPEAYLNFNLVKNSKDSPLSIPLFSSVNNYEKDKLFYAPSSLLPGIELDMACGSNAGYWDEFANSPSEHFFNVMVGDWIGWDYVLVSYDPNIHTKFYLQTNIVGQLLETNSGEIIKIRKFEHPKDGRKAGVMKLFFEYIQGTTILPQETIFVQSNPSIEFYASSVNHLGFESGKNIRLNIQPEPRIKNICVVPPPPAPTPFTILVNTQLTGVGTTNSSSFRLPAVGTNYTVDWGDGNIEVLSSTTLFSSFPVHVYSSPGIYQIQISGPLERIFFDNTGDRIKLLEIQNWGSIEWTSMFRAFTGCVNMIGTFLDIPNLSGVDTTESMFRNCSIFNSDINNWNMSTITNTRSMFTGATQFNQPLNNWNVSNVTNMAGMFVACSNFNQNIESWNVSSVMQMQQMFEGFSQPMQFNQPLNSWDVSSVTTMQNMFSGANNFNQPLNNWNVSNVTTMNSMFLNATSFNQSLETWNLRVSGVTLNGMLNTCGMNAENYSRTLIGWSNTVSVNSGPYNRFLGASGRTYDSTVHGGSPNDNAVDARSFLTTAPRSWSISGDTLI
jgi:surface protein